MINKKKSILLIAFILSMAAACKKDELRPQKPIADKVEIGTDNNKRGFIGMDFHFNAVVTAGDKIENVQVQIKQKNGETYSSDWEFNLSWPEFKGLKNSTVHKHFSIPGNAPKGNYKFIFTVTDDNGEKLEISSDFIIMDINDLPVNPEITIRGGLVENQIFKKGDDLLLNISVSGYKDDGQIYGLLIKNSLNHNPETISAIDFSKVIVLEQAEHKGSINNSSFRLTQGVKIGASVDNKLPAALEISGNKSWQSGLYTILILYYNSTHKVSVFRKIPININYN